MKCVICGYTLIIAGSDEAGSYYECPNCLWHITEEEIRERQVPVPKEVYEADK